MKEITLRLPDKMADYIKEMENKIDMETEMKRDAFMLYPYIEKMLINHGVAAELLGVNEYDLIDLYATYGMDYIPKDSIVAFKEKEDKALDYFAKKMGFSNKKKPNIVKIAIFYAASDWSWSELPDGCPEEYLKADLESRKALAAWFMTRGLKYFHSRKDDYFVFFYHGESAIHHYFVAVIDLDISRPWKFYFPDDEEERWERICYLDNTDENNRTIPVVYPPI